MVQFYHNYLPLIQVVTLLIILPQSLYFSLMFNHIYHLSVSTLCPLCKKQCHQHNGPVLPQLYPQYINWSFHHPLISERLYLPLIQFITQLIILSHSLHLSLLLQHPCHLSVPVLKPLWNHQYHQHNLPVAPQFYPQYIVQQVLYIHTVIMNQVCFRSCTHHISPVITLSVFHHMILERDLHFYSLLTQSWRLKIILGAYFLAKSYSNLRSSLISF